MKASDELEPVRTIISVWREKRDQCCHNQYRSQHEKVEAKLTKETSSIL
jgi:hypothetical protein